jgi:hypothetical protein
LLINIDKRELSPVKSTNIQGREAELDAYRGSARYAEHIKGLEGLERDGVDVGAGARNHKALNSSESEVAHASS